ncbi:exonuclease VIII [Caballeronia pedi]|uniref:Exonuclease VIII n=1 Tax=Caballeronia pedi TaxID=1777141 RepID=A0A158DVS7_9BURK|nr:PD-(D/E)XK nuclease-like domain-containing protein [Caballeronia pedi]SAK98520.1 exonuclease VIII [Caballeronia pedi]
MSVTLERLQGLVDLSNDDYHAGPGVSKSHLDVIAEKSPLHYWNTYLNPDRLPPEQKSDFLLGSAAHSAILEPDLFESSFVKSPAFNMRTKDGKQMFADFVQENPGKQILTPDDYQTCLDIRDAVYRHPTAPGLLSGGKPEQSFFVDDAETGELIKCRFDYLQDGGALAIDVKTTRNAHPRSFGKDAANFRYDIAVAWYFDVLRQLYNETPKYWVWLAIEKEPPYAIGLYYAKTEDILRAHDSARRDFMRIVNCKRANEWPDYGWTAEPLDFPTWMKR